MLETALLDFWNLLGLQSLPTGTNDRSVEIEGIGTVRLSCRGNNLALSGFVPSSPSGDHQMPARALSLTDYRSRTEGGHLHPVLSSSGEWGFMAFLPGESLSGREILKSFETLCSGLEKISSTR